MFNPEICDFMKKNNFEFYASIGSGGFSECYDVVSRQYNQHFVCKIISISGYHGEERKRSFENELNALIQVIHPNIIKVFKTFSTKTHVFLILEYCSKGDLSKYIRINGPITSKDVLYKFVSSILDALCYLEEKNIAHRDIKPSNILIDEYGRLKIADFGLSAFFDKSRLCEEYNGSLTFIAPEILFQKPYNSIKADVWSFGVTLYYMATGTYPFPLDNAEVLKAAIMNSNISIPENLDPTIRTILEGSLQRDPEKRMTFREMQCLVEKNMSLTRAISKPKMGKRVNSRILLASGSIVSSLNLGKVPQKRLNVPSLIRTYNYSQTNAFGMKMKK